ncbi:MAG: DUF3306 domain-containing protein [Alphaproteobacteria bacterium]|nr:DUF3306 domain-containing protein [Alphaproteobacteria bacterium]NNF24932.1 DUF3306 domain-containing protein [Paracoccaceae bacterium]
MSRAENFWSRRRAAVAAEEQASRLEKVRQTDAEAQAALDDKPDDEILDELGLPDPDTLGPGDDFKAFMTKAVPERLRRRALRKLWRSNPVLACVDGLNDYDDDFNSAAENVTVFKTAYQVGKGMLSHIEELQREADAILAEKAAPEGEPAEAVATADQSAETIETVDPAPGNPTVAEADAAAEPAAAPARRMSFSFEGTSA